MNWKFEVLVLLATIAVITVLVFTIELLGPAGVVGLVLLGVIWTVVRTLLAIWIE